jgi:hypothetical protein
LVEPMIFSGRRHRHPSGSRSIAEREQAAYVLLEEARLRCERLRDRAESGTERRALRTLHREIGLAGFAVSANLAAGRRRESLALARQRSARVPPDESGGPRVLAYLLEQADRAVEDGLNAAAVTDHVQLAQGHLLQARDLLAALRAAGRRTGSVGQSVATRH